MAVRYYEVRLERTVVFRKTYRVRASGEKLARDAARLRDEGADLDSGDLFLVIRTPLATESVGRPTRRHPAEKS